MDAQSKRDMLPGFSGHDSVIDISQVRARIQRQVIACGWVWETSSFEALIS
jgi:hypothetical protein